MLKNFTIILYYTDYCIHVHKIKRLLIPNYKVVKNNDICGVS